MWKARLRALAAIMVGMVAFGGLLSGTYRLIMLVKPFGMTIVTAAVAVTLGIPVFYLLGESFFRLLERLLERLNET